MIENEIVDLDSEQYTLGCMILEPSLIDECVLNESHYYYTSHKVVINALKKMRKDNEPIDAVTLVMTIQDSGDLDKINGDSPISYISNLALTVVSTASYKRHEKRVIEAWRLRYSKRAVLNVLNSNDPIQAKEMLSITIESLTHALEFGVEKKKDISESLKRIYNRIQNGGTIGIYSGFRDLDRMTMGWQNQDLIVIGGRPSMGKTAFILSQISNHLKDDDVYPHFFSLEMGEDPILQRLLGNIGRVDYDRMRTGDMRDGDWEKLNQAMAFLDTRKNRFAIHDRMGMTPHEIRAAVTKEMKEHPDKRHIVYIDYLTIMGYEGNADRYDLEITENTELLKKMAKELNIPVIVLAQLSRGVETRADKRPTMSDLRESGGIEQIADVIALLYRDEYYNRESESKGMIEVIVAKQRNGTVGTVNLAYLKEYGAFLNLEWRES